jgi:hypothetical protein
VSVVGDAIAAIKKVLLLEERIQSQGRKLEELSTIVVDMDKRLARLEGFIAGAAAAGGGRGRAPSKQIANDTEK